MRLDPNDQEAQEKFYKKLWFPMQKELGENLEPFFRHYLSMDGDIPTLNRVYYTFKEIYDKEAKNQEDIIKVMEELFKYSQYYSKFVSPENEENENLKIYFEKFNRLGVTTCYPLLLRLYEGYDNYKIIADEFEKCLGIIETFIVRRAVCAVPTNALNNYFPTIYNSLDESKIYRSLKDKLKSGSGARRMPDTNEFKQSLKNRKLYRKTARYLLEEIEKYPDNNELVNLEDLQVEHIMPQTLNDSWREELGDKWELIHNKYLDTLGNLTLTGYNAKYSNKPFIEKRDMENGFKKSGLRLNMYLAEIDSWNETKIRNMADDLTRKAVKMWRS